MSDDAVVRFYVDGGLLGRRNPSPDGVYWSVWCEHAEDSGRIVKRAKSLDHTTNNDAEWLAVREALLWATEHHPGARRIVIHSDSQLIVNQFSGRWRIKLARHHRIASECRRLAQVFPRVTVEWRPRSFMVERLGH